MNFVTADFIAAVAEYKFLLNHIYKQHVVTSIHNLFMKHYQQLSFKLITIMHSFANRVYQNIPKIYYLYNLSIYYFYQCLLLFFSIVCYYHYFYYC